MRTRVIGEGGVELTGGTAWNAEEHGRRKVDARGTGIG